MSVSTWNKQFSRLIIWVVIAASLAGIGMSCSERMICPAYQSAFIFDTTALKRKFSYFVNDTPKINKVVSKNRFLLVEPLSYRKTLASFRTIEMLPIYPVIPDSLRFQADNILLGDLDIKDSTGQTPLHPGLVGIKFNVEQENYMYYFRKILVLPDVRAGAAEMAKAKKKRKGPIQWIKNIFKRDKGESEQVAETAVDPSDEPQEKKGFFTRLRGKKKGEDETNEGAQASDPTQTIVEDTDTPPKKSFFQKLKDKFKKKDRSAEPPKPEKKPADKKDDGFE